VVPLDVFVNRRGRGPWRRFLLSETDSVVVPTSHHPNLYCALYEMKVLFSSRATLTGLCSLEA
jgi:hypothetical protein